MPAIPTKSGAWRRVLVVMADAAYGTMALIAWVISMGDRCLIKPLGNAGKKHGSQLGRRRYVIERTMAWFGNFRRLKVCYERTAKSAQGMHELAAALICYRKWMPPPRPARRRSKVLK
jgi:transposase